MECGRGETGGGDHSRSLCILRERPSRSNRRGAKGGHVIGVCGVQAGGDDRSAPKAQFTPIHVAPSALLLQGGLAPSRFSADRVGARRVAVATSASPVVLVALTPHLRRLSS